MPCPSRFPAALLALAALGVTTACADERDAAAPTAPASAAASLGGAAPNPAADAGRQQAAVCRAYRRQLAALRAAAVAGADAPSAGAAPDTLADQEAALAAIVADACD